MATSEGKLTRRTFLKATGFGAAAAALSACVAAAPTAGDDTAPAAEQIELDYWYIWGGRGGEGQVAGCDLFTEHNPNITMHPLTAGGVILDKTLAAFAAGDPPDLVDLILCAPLAGRGALIAVDDYIESSTVVDLENYQAAHLEAVNWAGERWGLPANEGLGWLGLARNRNLVQAAGLDEDALPADFEELHAWAEALEEIDDDGNVQTLGMDIRGILTYPDCWSVVMGKRYFDGETFEYNFDSEEFAEALQIAKSFYDRVGAEKIAEFKAAQEGQPIPSPSAAGKVGLFTGGSWTPGSLALNAAEGLEFGFSFVPDGAGEGKMPFFAGTHTAMILNGSENVDAAWQFLEFTSTDEYNRRVYDVSGFIMGTKSFIDSLDMNSLYPGLDFYTSGLSEGTRVWGIASDPNWYLAWDEFLSLEEEVGFGTTDPAEGLQILQEKLTTELGKVLDA
ncbi:MAG: extracellular solute-binding protein [Caldilineaceae bacterium]|nr:extracellular solute-binding protein [Caldilineaceae bacterium]